jgi:putative methionine-R-sulfoxide reductase with GAF domain
VTSGPPDRTEAYRWIEDRLRRGGPVDAGGFIDLAWEALSPTGVSWIGFYRHDSESDQLLLERCRDRPACSPIGLHGVCGQALRHRRTRIVRDVTELGEDYVACDPRDRAEIVIPLGPDVGTADRVLDLDSFDLDGFSDVDDRRLRTLLRLAGFTPIEAGPPLRSISTED